MHLRAAEVGGCAPRSLSLYLQQPALRVCSTEDLFTPSPPRVIARGGNWAVLPFAPPTQEHQCILCLDLAKPLPGRIDLNRHLLEGWRSCSDLGCIPCSGHCPSHCCILKPHKQETRETVSHRRGPCSLQLPQTEEQRGHTYT